MDYKKLLILVLAILIYSCDEDSFTKIIDVEIPEQELKLVLLANLDSSDDFHEMVISRTENIDDLGDFDTLRVDELKLTTPDKGDLFPEYKDGIYVLRDYDFIHGATYIIEVNDSSYPSLMATTTVPSAVEVTDLIVEVGETSFGQGMDVFKLTFADPANEKNYYVFEGSFVSRNENGNVCSDDYYFDFAEEELVSDNDWVSDISFNGRNKSITLSSYNFCHQTHERDSFTLRLLSFSEEYINYIESEDLAYDSQDNPFVEPTILYTNVEGGAGIFSISSASIIEGKF